MWTVVYIANSTELKDKICRLLAGNKIIYKILPISSAYEDRGICYNVLVPSAEVNIAHALILDEEL